jgi:hypothetical protein
MELVMRVVTVDLDFDFEHESIEKIEFKSNSTFLEYDLLIWNPNNLLREYTQNTFRGYPSLDEDNSARLVKDIQRRTDEMKEMLEIGRSIVILLPEPKQVYLDYGEKTRSGTGKNRRTTRKRNKLNLSEVIPMWWPDTTEALGGNIEVRAKEPFTSFWERNETLLAYRAYFKAPSGEPVFFIKGTGRVIGTYQKINNGNLIFIPYFSGWDIESDVDFGPDEAEDEFITSLIDLIEELNKDPGDFELPAWSKEYILPGETEERIHLISLEKDLEDILTQISRQKYAIAEQEKYKLLLSGSGRALEIQVKKVFEELGFTVIEGLPGRDDLILKYGQEIAVVEIKGISKSAAEKHAAQLEKWTSEYYIAKNVKPKGILLVNAYKNIPLRERKDAAFPNQMLAYSKKRDHCLITSQQLLSLYLDCKNNDKKKNSMIELMFNTKGTFNEYLDWTKHLHFENEITEVSSQAKKTPSLYIIH